MPRKLWGCSISSRTASPAMSGTISSIGSRFAAVRILAMNPVPSVRLVRGFWRGIPPRDKAPMTVLLERDGKTPPERGFAFAEACRDSISRSIPKIKPSYRRPLVPMTASILRGGVCACSLGGPRPSARSNCRHSSASKAFPSPQTKHGTWTEYWARRYDSSG